MTKFLSTTLIFIGVESSEGSIHILRHQKLVEGGSESLFYVMVCIFLLTYRKEGGGGANMPENIVT